MSVALALEDNGEGVGHCIEGHGRPLRSFLKPLPPVPSQVMPSRSSAFFAAPEN